MSNYAQYTADRNRREQAELKRTTFLLSLPEDVVNAIDSREDLTTRLQLKQGRNKLRPDDVLAILEDHDVDVTEALWNQVQDIYGRR